MNSVTFRGPVLTFTGKKRAKTANYGVFNSSTIVDNTDENHLKKAGITLSSNFAHLTPQNMVKQLFVQDTLQRLTDAMQSSKNFDEFMSHPSITMESSISFNGSNPAKLFILPREYPGKDQMVANVLRDENYIPSDCLVLDLTKKEIDASAIQDASLRKRLIKQILEIKPRSTSLNMRGFWNGNIFLQFLDETPKPSFQVTPSSLTDKQYADAYRKAEKKLRKK